MAWPVLLLLGFFSLYVNQCVYMIVRKWWNLQVIKNICIVYEFINLQKKIQLHELTWIGLGKGALIDRIWYLFNNYWSCVRKNLACRLRRTGQNRHKTFGTKKVEWMQICLPCFPSFSYGMYMYSRTQLPLCYERYKGRQKSKQLTLKLIESKIILDVFSFYRQ